MNDAPQFVSRTPPHSIEVEEFLLCCCILDGGETLSRCIESRVTPECFSFPPNRIIFERLCAIKPPFEPEMLIEELRSAQQLDAVGGVPYILQISGRCATTVSAASFITKLKDLWTAREMIKLSTSLVEQTFSEGKISSDGPKLIEQIVDLQIGQADRPAEFDMADKIGDKLPDLPTPIIIGLLRRRAMAMLAGPSKANKTWTLFHMAVCVATGTTWWGFPCQEEPVLVVELEVTKEECCHRVDAICEAMNVRPKKGMLKFLCLRGEAAAFEELEPLIVRTARKANARFIIYDTIYMMLGGREENSNSDMTDLLNHMARVGTRTDSACVFAHHFAKGDLADRDSMEKAAGAGALSRYPDAIITLSPHEETTELKPVFTVNLRLRSFAPQENFVIGYEHPLFHREGELKPEDLKRSEKRNRTPDAEKTTGRKKKFTDQEVLSYFPSSTAKGVNWTVSYERAKSGCGISRTTFECARRDMLMIGLLQCNDDLYKRTKPGDFEAEQYKLKISGVPLQNTDERTEVEVERWDLKEPEEAMHELPEI